MDEVLKLLKHLETRLARIECLLERPSLRDDLVKSHYSTQEVSSLTKQYGTKRASAFTVRLACHDGRIPDAVKREDGTWQIPKQAVLRILSVGIPPERRSASA